MENIAIIATVYNVEQYVSEMINSVLSQTYPFFKLIIVDDASTDNSLKICQDAAKNDFRITVLKLDNNVGLGRARNFGIDYAQKNNIPYLTFLDSDDYIEKHYLERLYNALRNSHYNIAIASYTHDIYFDSDETSIIDSNALYKYRKDYSFYPSNCATCKLYRSDIFKDARFNEKKHEDIFLIPKLILQEGKIVLVKTKLYFYRVREGSISFDNDSFSPNNLDRLSALESNFAFVIQNSIDAFYHFANEFYVYLNLLIERTKKNHKQIYKTLKTKKRFSLKTNKKSIITKLGKNNYYRFLLTDKNWFYKMISRISHK